MPYVLLLLLVSEFGFVPGGVCGGHIGSNQLKLCCEPAGVNGTCAARRPLIRVQ